MVFIIKEQEKNVAFVLFCHFPIGQLPVQSQLKRLQKYILGWGSSVLIADFKKLYAYVVSACV